MAAGARAFRRNLGSSSSKPLPPHSREPSSQRSKDSTGGAKAVEAGKKGPFVKINMDSVPIGWKVDLMAHAGYDMLSAAVDHHFRVPVLACPCTSLRVYDLVCRPCASRSCRTVADRIRSCEHLEDGGGGAASDCMVCPGEVEKGEAVRRSGGERN